MISVIIPALNHAKEAVECLASLERQTYKDFEVIMVDDGSTDGLAKVIADYHPSFLFTFIRFPENRGAPTARNEGFRHSKGELIIFLDADVMLVPKGLEKMLKALQDHPEAAFVYCSFYFGWKLFKGRPFEFQALRRQNYIHTSSLVRRDAFPGFDEKLKRFQDWDLWLTIAERGGRGVWIDEVLYRFQPRWDGMSRWMPIIFYHIPWQVLGFMPAELRRYREAEDVIKKKHHIVQV